MTAPRPDDPTPGAARGEDSGQRWPQVSLIVLADDPAQAARTLDGLLQDPYPGEFEILLAAPEQPGGRLVGEGGDAPAEAPPADPVDRLATRDPRVAVIHSRGVSQAGLVNAAAFAASYPILSPVRNTPGSWAERVVKAVAAMEVTGADVVGGAQVAVGLGSAESAIARAMNSRLAPGPTRSRSADLEGAVDSVRVVAFKREAFERVGGLDGTFSGAQDWELQHRVRQAGGMVWMDPALALGERAPGAIGELAAQTFRAGAWRRKVIAAHAATSTPRYLAAPTLVVALVAAVAGGLAGGAMGLGLMWWLAAAPALYAAAVAVGAAVAGAGLPLGGRVRLWWALIVIQLSWGAGFLVGLRRRAARASAGRPGPTDTMMR